MEDSETLELSKDELVDIIRKRPKIRRWFSRYFTKNGILRAWYRPVIFKEDEDGKLLFDIKTIRSNVPRWSAVYNFHKHPDIYKQRGGIRDRAIRVTKDKRNQRGQFLPAGPNEIKALSRTARTVLASDVLRGKPVLGTKSDEDMIDDDKLEELPTDLDLLRKRLLHERAESSRVQEMLRKDWKDALSDKCKCRDKVDDLASENELLTYENGELHDKVYN